MSTSSSPSRRSEGSTQYNDMSEYDSRKLFKAVVADINLRPSSDGSPVTIEKNRTVYDVIEQGPAAVMGSSSADVRWIHLPANNMAWVTGLMERLHQEQSEQNASRDESDQETTKFNHVLREDLWKKAFHGRYSRGIHCRFMMPFAIRYSSVDPEGPESDESESTWHKANVTALHMPYLHWETYNSWKNRQERIRHLKNLVAKGQKCKCLEEYADPFEDGEKVNEILLHQYLHHELPLHDRRTLDQSYFYNLSNVEHHDEDQVIGQHTWKNLLMGRDPARKMMMTDQLWMWVVDEKTIVTAFPETSTSHDHETDILYRLLENLPRQLQQGTTRSVNGLIALIVNHCTGVFHRSDINPDLAFFEFFALEIGAAKTDLDQIFSEFRNLSESVEKLWRNDDISAKQMSSKLDNLFSIKHEIRLLERVEKIISDLDKIDFICSQQGNVVHDLVKCRKSPSGGSSQHKSVTSRSIAELVDTIEERREAWKDMAHTAKSVHKSLHSLLDLKQRQATVSEARTVRFQVELSARQGQSIMLLTIFTIVLLPVSVMGTLFGMNAKQLNGGVLSMETIGKIMAPTTVTLVLSAFLLAFNQESRDVITQLCRGLYARVMGTRNLGTRPIHGVPHAATV